MTLAESIPDKDDVFASKDDVVGRVDCGLFSCGYPESLAQGERVEYDWAPSKGETISGPPRAGKRGLPRLHRLPRGTGKRKGTGGPRGATTERHSGVFPRWSYEGDEAKGLLRAGGHYARRVHHALTTDLRWRHESLCMESIDGPMQVRYLQKAHTHAPQTTPARAGASEAKRRRPLAAWFCRFNGKM